MPFRIFAGRRAKWVLATVVVLAVVAVFVLRGRKSSEITISRETTFLEGPIGEDGYVDYVAALNAKMAEGVTPENNAVVLLARALGPTKIPASIRQEFFAKLRILVPPQQGKYFLPGDEFARHVAKKDPHTYAAALKKEIKKGIETPWSREELPKLAAWLRKNEEPLAIVMQATRRRAWYCPIVLPTDGEASLWTPPRPVTNACPGFAKALTSRAMLAVREGRLDDAQSDLLTGHRLARLVAKGHSVIDFLMGCAVEALVCNAEIAALKAGRMTAKQLANYQQALRELRPLESPAEKINLGERLAALDMVVRMAKGILNDEEDGPLKGMVQEIQGGLFSLAILDWNIVLATINERFDQVYAVVQKPRFVQRKKAMDAHASFEERERQQTADKWFKSSTERSQDFGSILAMADAAFHTSASHDRAVSRLQLTRIAVALERHRKATGKFPAKLADLQPRYLKKIPQDLFTEKPFHYKRTKTGYLLYSVGPDMKDNGGGKLNAQNGGDIAVRMTIKP